MTNKSVGPRPTPQRPCKPVSLWSETIELLDQILVKNTESPTRSHRRSRAEELHHLVVQEAKRQGLVED